MNFCLFTGNLVRDVEVKEVGSTKVASFTIACSRKFKKKDGKEVTETNFFDIEAWDKQAETIAKFFEKGSYITVRCAAKQEVWEDKTTKTNRSKIKFRLEEFWFPPLGKRGGKQEEDGPDDNDSPPADDGDSATPF
jgi:single-strand DNA-binding protein